MSHFRCGRQLRIYFCSFSAFACFHTVWVKTGKAQCEHMFSALPLRADIAQQTRHVRFVPTRDSCTAAKNASLLDHLVGARE
jgi:hypothetical protein